MSELRISVALPQLLPVEGPEVVTRYAIRAEELGFAGLWSLDSVPVAQPRGLRCSTGCTS